MILATVSRLLAADAWTIRLSPASITILLPPMYSNDEPEGIGISFARNTVVPALNLIDAVI